MTKAEILEHLWQEYLDGNKEIHIEVWQKRPNTAAKVIVRMPEYPISVSYGFSKVCWPDIWNAKRGVKLAVRKALADIAKAIVASTKE